MHLSPLPVFVQVATHMLIFAVNHLSNAFRQLKVD
jgi:hypothetical protein